MITNFKNIFKNRESSFGIFFNRCQHGFTLAEVLITLLIIGVVASLVIPTLIAETEKAEIAVQVKKYQSILSQAVMNIKNDYSSILNSPLNSSSGSANGWNEFKKQLNLIKDCGITNGAGCWASVMYKHLNGTDWVNFNTYGSVGRGILQDGSFIDYETRTSCSENGSTTNIGPLYNSRCVTIYIDVNGYKPPNKSGRDVFTWHITKYGTVYPFGSLDDKFGGCDPTSDDVNPYDSDGAPGWGEGCTAKVIQEGKIDY